MADLGPEISNYATLIVFLFLLVLLAIIFSGQIGFSAAAKVSIVTGLMLIFIFAAILILYEVALIIIRIIQENRIPKS